MSYQRLETSTIGTEVAPALRCEVADPLWFLGRQWQVGELQGEDGGRPVALKITSRAVGVSHIRGGTPASPRGRFRGLAQAPLEPQIEGEARLDGPGRAMWSARLSAQLTRALIEGRAAAAVIEELRRSFPLDVPDDLRPTDRLLCTKGFDALALLEAVAAGTQKLRGRAAGVVNRFAEQIGAELSVDAAAQELQTWDPEHQEYQFHLTTHARKDPQLTLDAAEYHGRRADWFTFDASPSKNFSRFLARQPAVVDEVLASGIEFPGTPAARWWAFEDDEVSMAYLEGSDADLARAIVGGFVTTFGSDWLMAPVSARLGDLVSIEKILVTDSFGQVVDVPAMAAADHADNRTRPWRFFEISGDTAAAEGRAPLLYIAPTAADILPGVDLERVLLAHDEVSNVGWAIEEVVESGFARAHDRTAEVAPDSPSVGANGGPDETSPMRYQLDPSVPAHWLPLIPVRRTGDDLRWRQRGRVTPPADAPPGWGQARGRLLEPESRLLIHEEEIPRTGAEVVRRTRMTRANDGTPMVWVGRRKRLGNVQPSGVYLPDQIIGQP